MTWQGARMRTCGSSLLNENMEDDTLHKNCFFLSGRVLQKGSSGHGKFQYNNDCRKKKDFCINYHRKIVFYLCTPSDTRGKPLFFFSQKKSGENEAKMALIVLENEATSLNILSIYSKENATNHSICPNMLANT